MNKCGVCGVCMCGWFVVNLCCVSMYVLCIELHLFSVLGAWKCERLVGWFLFYFSGFGSGVEPVYCTQHTYTHTHSLSAILNLTRPFLIVHSTSQDPFDRSSLTPNMLQADLVLQARIQQWKDERKSKRH